MTNSLRPVFAPLLLSLLALSGCDEADPLDVGDTQLRFSKVIYQTPVSKSFKLDILPPDGDPGNDGPGGGGPVFDDILRNAPAIFASAYQGSIEAEEFCPYACKEADLGWDGAVTAEADLKAADAEWMENEKGELFAETTVVGEVAMGCVCE